MNTNTLGSPLRTHALDDCLGTSCCVHNPSDHHMREWPLVFRVDLGPPVLAERVCSHGCGHPDPDSMAWIVARDPWAYGVHGCDGCCRA